MIKMCLFCVVVVVCRHVSARLVNNSSSMDALPELDGHVGPSGDTFHFAVERASAISSTAAYGLLIVCQPLNTSSFDASALSTCMMGAPVLVSHDNANPWVRLWSHVRYASRNGINKRASATRCLALSQTCGCAEDELGVCGKPVTVADHHVPGVQAICQRLRTEMDKAAQQSKGARCNASSRQHSVSRADGIDRFTPFVPSLAAVRSLLAAHVPEPAMSRLYAMQVLAPAAALVAAWRQPFGSSIARSTDTAEPDMVLAVAPFDTTPLSGLLHGNTLPSR